MTGSASRRRVAFDPLAIRRDTAPVPLYDDALTLRSARRLYFDANGFGEGGYDAKWVKLKAGPVPIVFPNTPQRVRSVRLHDLHHVVTDYATDWTGEAEIGAWEIASNCRDHHAAWVLNLFAFAIGLFLAPGAMWRAFFRGRCSDNLYDQNFRDSLLDERVGHLRKRLGLDKTPNDVGPADVFAFLGWSAAGLATLGAGIALLVAPLVLLVRLLIG